MTRGAAHRVEYRTRCGEVLPNAGTEWIAPLFRPSTLTVAALRTTACRAAPRSRDASPSGLVGGVAMHTVDVFTTPIRDGAGKLAGLIVFLVDVSNDPIPVQTSGTSGSTHDRERPA